MPKFLWTQKQDIGPKPRLGHALAYDSARQRTVLFGGNAILPGWFNDTWEWDGENWTQITDLGPRPRLDFGMAYDSQRRVTVLFGGMTEAIQSQGDTWEWDGENWTQVEDRGPAPRSQPAMAFDPNRDRVVLFGGSTPGGPVADTWEWDGEQWTQTAEAGPAPRAAHRLAYDSSRKRLILFGGWDEQTLFNDTWGWDGATWTQLSDIGPAARRHAALVSAGGRLVLFGGIGVAAPAPTPILYGDTWEWDGKRWVQRTDFGPAPRWGHSMAYDDAKGRLVLFGGLANVAAPAVEALLGDTWEAPVAPAAIVPDQEGQLASLILAPNTGVFEEIAAGGFHVVCTVTRRAPSFSTLPVLIKTNIPNGPVKQVVIPAGIMEGFVDIILPDSIPVGAWTFQAILQGPGEVKEATFTVT